jgi:hypothetical protein
VRNNNVLIKIDLRHIPPNLRQPAL